MLERSGGISVALRQPPLAYSSKSSPGFTAVLRIPRSTPIACSVFGAATTHSDCRHVINVEAARTQIFIGLALQIAVRQDRPKSQRDERIIALWRFSSSAALPPASLSPASSPPAS